MFSMFICTLTPDNDVTFTTLKRDNEIIVRVAIGYDSTSSEVISLFCVLSPLIGYSDIPGYELVFNLLRSTQDGNEISAYWDGEETKAFLTDGDERRRVRALLIAVVGSLLDETNANLVSMTTHTPNLPPKALEKFYSICAIFRDKGFTAGKADVWHGQHIWMMKRQEEPGVNAERPS